MCTSEQNLTGKTFDVNLCLLIVFHDNFESDVVVLYVGTSNITKNLWKWVVTYYSFIWLGSRINNDFRVFYFLSAFLANSVIIRNILYS